MTIESSRYRFSTRTAFDLALFHYISYFMTPINPETGKCSGRTTAATVTITPIDPTYLKVKIDAYRYIARYIASNGLQIIAR